MVTSIVLFQQTPTPMNTKTKVFAAMLAIGLFGSCTKDGPQPVGTANRGSATGFQLVQKGPHQLVLVPVGKMSSQLIVLDWIDQTCPQVELAAPIASFELDNEGHDLVLVGGGEAMVRFTVRDVPISGRGEAVVRVKGISQIKDARGFDLEALVNSKATDGFAAVDDSRIGRTSVSPKDGGGGSGGGCCSGGPGSTSCSQGGGGQSCTVTCEKGYYACCYCAATSCRCIANS